MQNQMDERQKMMMQQAWAESHAQEIAMIRQHEAMNQVYQAEMEKAQAEVWKDDFIENEVLNAKEKELNDVIFEIYFFRLSMKLRLKRLRSRLSIATLPIILLN